jgi:hypothetical protein
MKIVIDTESRFFRKWFAWSLIIMAVQAIVYLLTWGWEVPGVHRLPITFSKSGELMEFEYLHLPLTLSRWWDLMVIPLTVYVMVRLEGDAATVGGWRTRFYWLVIGLIVGLVVSFTGVSGLLQVGGILICCDVFRWGSRTTTGGTVALLVGFWSAGATLLWTGLPTIIVWMCFLGISQWIAYQAEKEMRLGIYD